MKKVGIARRSQRQPRRRDRNRVQKVKGKRVIPLGEHPGERVLKNGKVRHFDLLGKHKRDDHISRKTREFIATMTHFNSHSNRDIPKVGEQLSTQRNENNRASDKKTLHTTEQTPGFEKPRSHRNEGAPQPALTNRVSGKRFDGMTSGESLSEYSARLRKESQQMAIELAKKGNHQTEKRRAYNKKRREGVARRKRRRRGECGDSDVEDDTEHTEGIQSIGHLPAYWQEIVYNNGRPVSAKKKKRMGRTEKEATMNHAFRDQVDRPPNLTVQPVRRSGNASAKSS